MDVTGEVYEPAGAGRETAHMPRRLGLLDSLGRWTILALAPQSGLRDGALAELALTWATIVAVIVLAVRADSWPVSVASRCAFANRSCGGADVEAPGGAGRELPEVQYDADAAP